MKEALTTIIKDSYSVQQNINVAREYIQKYLMYILYKQKLFKKIIFTGGTALRFIHDLKRFSEDLDFSLLEHEEYSFAELLAVIKREFLLANYNLEVKYNDKKTVNSALIQFPDLLYEFGLSSQKNEKFTIKLEVDTNPPRGGHGEISLHKAPFMFSIFHYDLESLFAGKLHALLTRKYTKGRDWYDLIWYLTSYKQLSPNMEMLSNALNQTASDVEANQWRARLIERSEVLEMDDVKNDIFRFLEDPFEAEVITKENIKKLLSSS